MIFTLVLLAIVVGLFRLTFDYRRDLSWLVMPAILMSILLVTRVLFQYGEHLAAAFRWVVS